MQNIYDKVMLWAKNGRHTTNNYILKCDLFLYLVWILLNITNIEYIIWKFLLFLAQMYLRNVGSSKIKLN